MPPDAVTGGSASDPRDAAWVGAWVDAAWRRWRGWTLLHATVCGVGAGLALRTVGSAVVGASLAGAALLIVVTFALVSRRFRDVTMLLVRAEASQPDLRNALIAWHEGHDHLAPAVAGRLARQARAGLDNAAWPQPYGRKAWLIAVGCVVAGLLAPTLLAFRLSSTAGRSSVATTPPTGEAATSAPIDWTVTVDSPAYTRIPRAQLRRPTRIDVIAGARVHLSLTHWPSSARASVGSMSLVVNVRGDEADADFRPEASDVLMLRGPAGDVLHTIAIVVRPDAPPATRIVAPGADVRRDAAVGTVPIRVTAQDDIGLRDLRLRFTKVSGSGESFTFVDGEWPVTVSRTSATQWTASHTVDLATLGLAPGDSVVYHAVAHDARPGPEGAAESERFLVEITKPGQRTGGEYSLPEPEEKFALSQRMVIQLTERLLERRPRLSASDYRNEAQALAMAQRRVRAEFVFMLGGEVEDEVAEAEHSHEVEAGRLDNQGKGDLTEAVRQMAQAESRLTDADLREALPYEYRALAAVQAAFGKSRYFMRTLPAPVQIDPARRLQGDRAMAASARWSDAPLPDDRRDVGLRLLGRLESLHADDGGGRAALLPDLVALERGNPEWVALVQGVREPDGALAVTRALRQRLAASAIRWSPIPLPRAAAEAALSAGERPR